MLKISHLKKNYKDFSLDCSMEVQPGMITGLIGKNGSGKSTTFKAILGLIRPDGGRIELLGKKTTTDIAPEVKQKLGVVFADSGFSMYLTTTGVANILENTYQNFDRAEFLEQCSRFHLPEDKKIKDFSTGMKAKLKVLVALSHKAELLILDEPTVGLDVVARDEVLTMLREYMEKNENSAILISSHISSDLENLCDDLYMIHNGKIILHEDTDVLLADYAVLKVSEDAYGKIERQYILKTKNEPYGYSCLTNQKQFYLENYPNIAVENGRIDDLIVMMED
jgi:ABC-2 type transport system ATP-binding protein